jgi:hypothetical protein
MLQRKSITPYARSRARQMWILKHSIELIIINFQPYDFTTLYTTRYYIINTLSQYITRDQNNQHTISVKTTNQPITTSQGTNTFTTSTHTRMMFNVYLQFSVCLMDVEIIFLQCQETQCYNRDKSLQELPITAV